MKTYHFNDNAHEEQDDYLFPNKIALEPDSTKDNKHNREAGRINRTCVVNHLAVDSVIRDDESGSSESREHFLFFFFFFFFFFFSIYIHHFVHYLLVIRYWKQT